MPLRLVDELHEVLETSGVLDGIARLLQDGAEQAVRAAEFSQGLAARSPASTARAYSASVM
jgi:hypothetical protein